MIRKIKTSFYTKSKRRYDCLLDKLTKMLVFQSEKGENVTENVEKILLGIPSFPKIPMVSFFEENYLQTLALQLSGALHAIHSLGMF